LLYDHLKAMRGEAAVPAPRKKGWIIFFAIFGTILPVMFFSVIIALVSWGVARQKVPAGITQPQATTTVPVRGAATTTP
ncbi:MAG: hypothetical protein KGH97_03770, partial [Patescibacteria group bacterium]|nr:hypothetical protein [Patescibacteria group bacterium]